MKKAIITLLLLLPIAAQAQSFIVFDIDDTNFPVMRAKFFAFDDYGKQLSNLTTSDFEIMENGELRDVISVSCPETKEALAISSVLTIDVSGSMTEGMKLNIAKEAGKAWIYGLPLGKSECAITAFDTKNYMLQDFTTNRTRLIEKLNSLSADGATDFDAGFINQMSGALIVSEKGKYKKLVILVTDGFADGNETAIIQKANEIGAAVYCVTIGFECPDVLKNIAEQTGGQWFENITSVEQAKETYLKILQISQEIDPCEIEWKSGGCDFDKEFIVTIPGQSLQTQLTYKVNPTVLPHFEFIPSSTIRFGAVEPETGLTKNVKITAMVDDIIIHEVKTNNNEFKVVDFGGSNPPFTLNIGQSRDLAIEFTPSDSSMQFAKIELESNACSGRFLYCSGGYRGVALTKPTLKLTHPNGGEVFVAGSDTIITWDGILPEETVQIEFSSDNGLNWDTLSNNSYSLKEIWNKIDKVSSDECLVKVKQFGDTSLAESETITLEGHFDPVYSVCYSPDGSMIASGSSDGTIKIWNMETGSEIRTIEAHYYDVNSLCYSTDGSRLASGSGDGRIKIWDPYTGTMIKMFPLQSGGVKAICYSPDGKQIASGNDDNEIKILDSETGDEIRVIEGENYNYGIFSICYSPDGKRISSGGEDKKVRIWDVNTSEEINTFHGHSGFVKSVSYNPDGSRIASSSNDRTINIYDANTGVILKTLSGHSSYVQSVSYSPDGSRIASGGYDDLIRLWESNSGEEIKTLSGHSDYIRCLCYSPDGRSIASGSGDGTIKIWDVSKSILQEDQSDAVFSIVIPQAEARSIDMGREIVGEMKDSLFVDFVVNTGSYKVRIDSIYFTGAEAGAFTQVSAFPVYEIDVDKAQSTEFRFIPNRVGLHTAKLNIITQAETLEYDITGIGEDRKLQLACEILDFGEVEMSNEKVISDTVLIRNVTNQQIDITGISQLGPDMEQFHIISGGEPFTLAPSGDHKMTLQFLPQYAGRTSGQIGFEYDGAGSPARVQLFGTGKGGLVYAADDSAYAGDQFNIKLMLGNVKPEGIAKLATDYEATIRFQRTLLAPSGSIDWQSTVDSIYITIKGKIGNTVELSEIPVIACLGSTEETSIDVVEMNLLDASGKPIEYEFEKQSGIFTLLGVCREGGTRLINPDEEAGIINISPNPAEKSLNIEISLIEEGQTELSIFNSFGESVQSVFSANNETTGTNKFKADISKLANGVYYVILKTPNQHFIEKVLVIR